jgi:hypothetical protein
LTEGDGWRILKSIDPPTLGRRDIRKMVEERGKERRGVETVECIDLFLSRHSSIFAAMPCQWGQAPPLTMAGTTMSPFGILKSWPLTDPGTQSSVCGASLGGLADDVRSLPQDAEVPFSRHDHDHVPTPPPLNRWSSILARTLAYNSDLNSFGPLVLSRVRVLCARGLASVSDGRHFAAFDAHGPSGPTP